MNIDSGAFYSKNDEWVRIDGNTATIGITDYAQSQLSDIVFVEITVEEGNAVEAAECIATVESVKAASDIYSPVTGTVAETNANVLDAPEKINKDPFGEAWLVKITLDGEFDPSELMNADAYKQYCDGREH